MAERFGASGARRSAALAQPVLGQPRQSRPDPEVVLKHRPEATNVRLVARWATNVRLAARSTQSRTLKWS
jgi:hypothetical protein